MLPAREPAKVLRPAGGRSLAAAASAAPPVAPTLTHAREPAPMPTAVREPAPLRELAPDQDDPPPAPAPSRHAARAPAAPQRQAVRRESRPVHRAPPREEQAPVEPMPSRAPSGSSSSKMFVFMALGILAGAAAAVFAVKYLLKI
jgi:hypothetical protein